MRPPTSTTQDICPPIKLPTIRERVLVGLKVRGRFGMTDRELVEMLAIPGDSVRPIRVALTREGLIVDAGRQRETRSGRLATVWILADQQLPARPTWDRPPVRLAKRQDAGGAGAQLEFDW